MKVEQIKIQTRKNKKTMALKRIITIQIRVTITILMAMKITISMTKLFTGIGQHANKKSHTQTHGKREQRGKT